MDEMDDRREESRETHTNAVFVEATPFDIGASSETASANSSSQQTITCAALVANKGHSSRHHQVQENCTRCHPAPLHANHCDRQG